MGVAAAVTIRRASGEVEVKLTAILKDWQDIRTKSVAQQRQLLRKLVPDRIAVTPHVRGDRKWVDWHGSMELAPIVSGITPALGDALSMDGRWWPQRDSNPCFSLERAVSWASRRWGRPCVCCVMSLRRYIYVALRGKRKWLGEEGSNPHYQGQNLASYH
jgi:hypothetical protein